MADDTAVMAPGFGSKEWNFGAPADDESPVLKPLAQQMKISLVLSPDSKVWLLHDRGFEEIVMWAEYDIDTAALSLIMRGGRIQALGLPIEAPVRKYLRLARQMFTMQMEGEKIVDMSGE